jgi:hypothetical protein
VKKKIVSIERHLKEAKIDKRKEAHAVMEAFTEVPVAVSMSQLTASNLERWASEEKKSHSQDSKIAGLASEIEGNFAYMRNAEREIQEHIDTLNDLMREKFGEGYGNCSIEEPLELVKQFAIKAGFCFGLVMRRAEAVRGKTEWPEWEFIRQAWKEARSRERKPNRPDVIDAGLAKFQTITGKPSALQTSKFIPHFREQVIDKTSR